MRSDKIHRALAQGMNRFEVCQLVSKGVKATHKTGARFEDSINDVLQYLGTHVTHHGKSSPGHSPGEHEEPQAGGVGRQVSGISWSLEPGQRDGRQMRGSFWFRQELRRCARHRVE